MKYRLFTLIELLILSVACAMACDVFETDISYPFTFHFYQEEEDAKGLTLPEMQMERNIESWQALTSRGIPAADIKEAVYGMTLHELQTEFNGQSDNRLINWIKSHDAKDLREYLLLAKETEELRSQINSPWYYPSHKAEYVRPEDSEGRLMQLLKQCKAQAWTRLADRYALQGMRILRTLRRHKEGLDFYNKTMKGLSDKNLMKEMALGYAAGFHLNLGDTVTADRIFAQIGDFASLSKATPDKIMQLAHHNPESTVMKARLNHIFGYGDDKSNIPLSAVADAALGSPKVENRGDWLYMKAFIEGVYKDNWRQAAALSRQARGSRFSDRRMADDARFFNACAEAMSGNFSNLESDLKWMLGNYPDFRQGTLFFIVPSLMERGRITEALLVANTFDTDAPYASAGFQLLLSRSPEEVENYRNALHAGNGIFGTFKGEVIDNDDYLNEIIGTLHLRRGEYAKGAEHLRKVSKKHQQSTNLYKGGYLGYNPWDYAYEPESKWRYSLTQDGQEDDYDMEWGIRPKLNKERVGRLKSQIDAKLNFALKMAELQNAIKHAKSSDERNLSRIQYAIGRYNSFNTCWALTQYWNGNAEQRHYQPLYFGWDGTFTLDYLLDTPREMKGLEGWMVDEITTAYEALKGDAAKARASMMLRNYRTIARRYPNSEEGRQLAARCDRWKDWL